MEWSDHYEVMWSDHYLDNGAPQPIFGIVPIDASRQTLLRDAQAVARELTSSPLCPAVIEN
jgi:hypothetical protein